MAAAPPPHAYHAKIDHSFLAALLLHRDHEQAIVAHLSDAGRLIAISEATGSKYGVDLPLRAIVADALNHDARTVLLAHNHPSGDPQPSETDIETTRQLVTLLRPLGIRVYDHLILTRSGGTTSFRALGWL